VPLVDVFLTNAVQTSDGPGPGVKHVPPGEAAELMGNRRAVYGEHAPARFRGWRRAAERCGPDDAQVGLPNLDVLDGPHHSCWQHLEQARESTVAVARAIRAGQVLSSFVIGYAHRDDDTIVRLSLRQAFRLLTIPREYVVGRAEAVEVGSVPPGAEPAQRDRPCGNTRRGVIPRAEFGHGLKLPAIKQRQARTS
jgi:hypothetical protein